MRRSGGDHAGQTAVPKRIMLFVRNDRHGRNGQVRSESDRVLREKKKKKRSLGERKSCKERKEIESKN